MARKIHAIAADDATECKIPLGAFPKMATTALLATVTCQGCLSAIRRRSEAVGRDEIAKRRRQEEGQIDLATRRDVTELKSFVEDCIAKLKSDLRQPPPQRYIGVEECAAYIGRTEKAVRRLVAQRAIPHIRVDRRVTFDRQKIDRWMDRRSKRVLFGYPG
jgi:excisionase family DNA binding protein